MNVRFGVVGTNFIVDWIIRGALLDPRFQLTALYSRTQETGEAFAAKYGVKTVFTDLEQMAQSDLIDAVYIASPNALHAAQTMLFIRNGKHVLCEKAFASNAREVRTVIDVARQTKVTVMEAIKSTLSPYFEVLRSTLPRLGTIRRYFASYCQFSSRYDRFKAGELLNAFNPELSNGALLDIGIYTLYPMVVLFGRPLSVQATGIKLSSGVDGAGSILFQYPDMEASVLYSKIVDSIQPSEIQGEAGTLMVDRINQIGSLRLVKRDGEAEELTLGNLQDEYYYEIKEFIDLIEQGKQESSVNSWTHTLIVAELMDEVRRQLGIVYPADKN